MFDFNLQNAVYTKVEETKYIHLLHFDGDLQNRLDRLTLDDLGNCLDIELKGKNRKEMIARLIRSYKKAYLEQMESTVHKKHHSNKLKRSNITT